MSLGAKSHTAQGFRGAASMTFSAVGRSAPQQMKPTPMGRTEVGVGMMGLDSQADVASESRDEKEERSVPAPKNPRPDELETACARGVVAMRRMGADVMRGLEVQG